MTSRHFALPIFSLRFLDIRGDDKTQTTLERLSALTEKIRDLEDEAELRKIEDEIDAMLRARLTGTVDDEGGAEALAMIAVAQRLDNLVHHRRVVLSAPTSGVG